MYIFTYLLSNNDNIYIVILYIVIDDVFNEVPYQPKSSNNQPNCHCPCVHWEPRLASCQWEKCHSCCCVGRYHQLHFPPSVEWAPLGNKQLLHFSTG